MCVCVCVGGGGGGGVDTNDWCIICFRPQDKSVYWKISFFISHLKHVVGTKKNRLNETVLLSTQNICYN